MKNDFKNGAAVSCSFRRLRHCFSALYKLRKSAATFFQATTAAPTPSSGVPARVFLWFTAGIDGSSFHAFRRALSPCKRRAAAILRGRHSAGSFLPIFPANTRGGCGSGWDGFVPWRLSAMYVLTRVGRTLDVPCRKKGAWAENRAAAEPVLPGACLHSTLFLLLYLPFPSRDRQTSFLCCGTRTEENAGACETRRCLRAVLIFTCTGHRCVSATLPSNYALPFLFLY